VFWLLADNEWVPQNLRREAALRGIEADRLVFAGRAGLADHLARHRLADLFIDTLPCNAHTTASDALWAGLPVLTCAGRSLASRVAGSLLHAIGLPELVTDNLEAFKAKAVGLASHPEELRAIREKLARNRGTTPLFDTGRFCQHIEAGFLEAWETWQQGGIPRSFAVAATN
jgi:predicted O-linked N-acetylglucosamine transferase (SPINDLY family)